MLRRSLLLGGGLAISMAGYAQTPKIKVAVGTRTPTEHLDINGSVRVRTLPTNGEAAIFTKSDGTASPNFDQQFNQQRVLMADKNGVLGLSQTMPHSFFYMPPVVLPLSQYAVNQKFAEPTIYKFAVSADAKYNGDYQVDLHKLYNQQFNYGAGTNHVRSSASSTLPLYASNELDFYITYYDKEVFDKVSVDDSGILRYSVKKKQNGTDWVEITPTAKTFMNVIFRVK